MEAVIDVIGFQKSRQTVFDARLGLIARRMRQLQDVLLACGDIEASDEREQNLRWSEEALASLDHCLTRVIK